MSDVFIVDERGRYSSVRDTAVTTPIETTPSIAPSGDPWKWADKTGKDWADLYKKEGKAAFIEQILVQRIDEFLEWQQVRDEKTQSFGMGEAKVSGHVRRPLAGIEIKKEAHATLSVETLPEYSASGELKNIPARVPLFNASSRSAHQMMDTVTANFLLQSTVLNQQEKSQVLETFGSSYVYFFGPTPAALTCSAVLLDSDDFEWKSEFLSNYARNFSGTRLAGMRAVVHLSYNDIDVYGYMISCQVAESAQDPYKADVNFTILISRLTARAPVKLMKYRAGSAELAEPFIRTVDLSSSFIGRMVAFADAQNSGASGVLETIRSSWKSIRKGIRAVNSAIDNVAGLLYGRQLAIPKEFIEGYNPALDEFNTTSPIRVTADGKLVKTWVKPALIDVKYTGDITDRWYEYLAEGDAAEWLDYNSSTYAGERMLVQGIGDQMVGLRAQKEISQAVEASLQEAGLRTERYPEAARIAARVGFGAIQMAASYGFEKLEEYQRGKRQNNKVQQRNRASYAADVAESSLDVQ